MGMSAGPHDELRVIDAYWAQLRAVDDRLLRRAQVRAYRRRLARTLAFAVLALLLAATAALAAKALLFGDSAPRSIPSEVEVSVFGAIERGETRLLGMRRPDPDRGPPWDLRVWRTDRGRICLQAGRVVDGRLVALGVARAFGDDGRAHPLQVESLLCGAQASGRALRAVIPEPMLRSGLRSTERHDVGRGCVMPAERRAAAREPARLREFVRRARVRGDAAAAAKGLRHLPLVVAERRRLARVPDCAEADLRTLVVGFAGSNVASVTVTSRGFHQRLPTKASQDGAFLFVLTGHHARPRVLGEFRGGVMCSLWSSLRDPRPVSSACRRAFAGKP